LHFQRLVVAAATSARDTDAAPDLLPRLLVFVLSETIIRFFGDIGKDTRRISVNLAGGERSAFVNYSLTDGRWSAIFAYNETQRKCADCRSADGF
jgi:hypothetical protein